MDVTSNSRLAVKLGNITLKNPVIPASGCFGFGYEMALYYDINCLGAISIKGTTLNPRYGNPLPRIAETPSGILNSVGLQNPGIHKVIAEEIPKLRKFYSGPIIANISGFSEKEYTECCRLMTGQPGVEIIELNVSCPNVHGGGMSFGTDAGTLRKLVEKVKRTTSLPLFIKLTPNVTDITEMARAAEDGGADGLCLINTLLGMRIDLKTRKPILANTFGGLSGPAVFPVALRMIYQTAKAVSLPIIGCGGVSSASDVIEMMMAGASAVEVGAATLVKPTACAHIIRELPAVMDRFGIKNLNELQI